MLFEKDEARKPRGSGVTFPLCVFFFFFGITFLFLLRGSREVQLSNVTWLDLLDAVQRLREMKVKACYDMVQTYTRDVPSCTVISQKPEIGTIVKSGQVIMLKMSRGPKVDRTPDFLGKNFDNAQSELLNDKNSLWDGLNI